MNINKNKIKKIYSNVCRFLMLNKGSNAYKLGSILMLSFFVLFLSDNFDLRRLIDSRLISMHPSCDNEYCDISTCSKNLIIGSDASAITCTKSGLNCEMSGTCYLQTGSCVPSCGPGWQSTACVLPNIQYDTVTANCGLSICSPACPSASVTCYKCGPPSCVCTGASSCSAYTEINNPTSCTPGSACAANTTCNACQKCNSGGANAPGNCVADATKDVNGGWSAWSTCTPGSCGQTQTRACNNPSPACAGAACVGSPTQACATTDCGDPDSPSNPSPNNSQASPLIVSTSNVTLSWSDPAVGRGFDYFPIRVWDTTANAVFSCGTDYCNDTVPNTSNSFVYPPSGSLISGHVYKWWVDAYDAQNCNSIGTCPGDDGYSPNVQVGGYFKLNSPPSYTSLTITNSVGTTVSPEAPNRNQICQPIFTARTARFVVNATDPDGNTDLSKIEIQVAGVGYSAVPANGVGVFNVTFPSVYPVPAESNILVKVYDKSGDSTSWIDTGRGFRVWDCAVNVSGTLYDGSHAVFEIINCSIGSSDFLHPAPAIPPYALTYQSKSGVDTDKVMNITAPNYNSGANYLKWGGTYQSIFTGVDGDTPQMRYPGNNACNNTNASFVVDNVSDPSRISVNPYMDYPSLTLDYSTIFTVPSWFQVSGAGVIAKNNITNNIPKTCIAPCIPAVSMKSAISSDGLVAATSISKGNGSFGDTNNWGVSKNVISESYSYKYFYNEYFVKLGQGKAVNAGTSAASFSQITTAVGGTGVVFVKGNLTIDANNVVAPGNLYMVVVSGSITVNSNVSSMQGIFISDGDFIAGSTDVNKLTIEGSLYSRNDVKLSRSYSNGTFNNRNPAIVVNYRPDFIFAMPGKLTKIVSGWREGL